MVFSGSVPVFRDMLIETGVGLVIVKVVMQTSAIVHISMFESLYRVSTKAISKSSIMFDVEAQTQCRL